MKIETLAITELSAMHVRVEASPDAAQLFDEEHAWGTAYLHTLGSLGIEQTRDGQSLDLTGNIALVQNRIASNALLRRISMIAQASGMRAPYDFQQDSQAQMVHHTLSQLASNTLPDLLRPDATFAETAASVTAQFGFALLSPRQLRIMTGSIQREAA